MAASPRGNQGEASSYVQMVTRAAFDVFLLQVVAVLIRYVTQVLLARWMKSTDYGIYAYAWAWNGQLIPIALIGLQAAALRFIPEYVARGERAHLNGILSGGTSLVVGWGALIGCVGAASAGAFANQRVAPALIAALLCLPLSTVTYFFNAALRALYRANWAVIDQLLRPLAILIGAFYLMRFGHLDAASASVCAVAATCSAVLVAGVIIWRSLPSAQSTRRTFEFRTWLRVGVPIGVTDYFSGVVGGIGTVMLGLLVAPRVAGLYSAAYRTASFLWLPVDAANSLATPVFASLNAQKKREDLQAVLVRLAHIMFWPSLLAGIGLIAVSPLTLGLFGKEFRTAIPAFAVMVAGQVAGNSAGSVANILQMTGSHDRAAYIIAACAVMAVILSLILIPIWGMTGAALASSLSFVAWKYIMHHYVVSTLGVNPSILYALRMTRRRRLAQQT